MNSKELKDDVTTSSRNDGNAFVTSRFSSAGTYIPDMSQGILKENITRILSGLSITDYWFENGALCLPKNVKYELPNRELTMVEKSIIDAIRLNIV